MHTRSFNGLSALLIAVADSTEEALRTAVDLSPRELAALVLVRNRAGCTVGWLHERLGLTQSGAVRLVDRLERLQYIRRTRQAGQRQVALTMTPAGALVAQQGVDARARVIDDQLSGLSEDERLAFVALADRALAVQSRSRDEGDEVCRLCDWERCRPECPVDGWTCDSEGRRRAWLPRPDRRHPLIGG